MNLLDSFWDYSHPVRAIRIKLSNLLKNDVQEQLSFFNDDKQKLNKSIQEIKMKYGKEQIFIASDTSSFINRKNEDEEL